MEIFIRLIVVVIKAIAMIISPILDTYFYPRKPRTTLIPPIRNKLLTLSVQELRSRLRSRQLTSVELVRTYIERIESVNKHLNAIVESRFSAALEEASETDDLIASCQSLADVEKLFEERPLLGLPVTIKESCALEGMTFSVGSLARRDIKAEADGEAVKRLKSAGAIPLLVSATPEYCFSIETDTLLNGRCLNPYDFERTPGGSSGGRGRFERSWRLSIRNWLGYWRIHSHSQLVLRSLWPQTKWRSRLRQGALPQLERSEHRALSSGGTHDPVCRGSFRVTSDNGGQRQFKQTAIERTCATEPD
ncbi:fatty-acid amide hydrolase 2-A isoform X1 [Drosophila ficusphila]|uniref:fatty-acid amide hydrolase 2-A isoform X1 n=1 Tax=Drosophila ficusphila TaxID=30025 RepID=UPI001C8AED4C|nr:fatty-acid amide hydrolase 2-A isoform X1 [Drosophila ficusphila]